MKLRNHVKPHSGTKSNAPPPAPTICWRFRPLPKLEVIELLLMHQVRRAHIGCPHRPKHAHVGVVASQKRGHNGGRMATAGWPAPECQMRRSRILISPVSLTGLSHGAIQKNPLQYSRAAARVPKIKDRSQSVPVPTSRLCTPERPPPPALLSSALPQLGAPALHARPGTLHQAPQAVGGRAVGHPPGRVQKAATTGGAVRQQPTEPILAVTDTGPRFCLQRWPRFSLRFSGSFWDLKASKVCLGGPSCPPS